ncbi:unnamed protein product [Camellia sinensis]
MSTGENGKECGRGRLQTKKQHVFEEGKSVVDVGMEGVGGDDGVPGDEVSVGHFVEHSAGRRQVGAFRVHIDERGLDEDVGVKAAADEKGERMEDGAVSDGTEVGTSLQHQWEDSKGIGGGYIGPETDGVIRRCWASDIRIYQWQSGYTALNIPQYTVQIVNEAWGGGDVFDVHISCGEFASFSLVNPMVFRRIGFTHDCLLLNGGILLLGEVITFHLS